MSPSIVWLVPSIALFIILIALFRHWRKAQRYRRWLFMMRKTLRLPDMKDCGDGWVQCTCTNCYHRFLWWRNDKCICTKCGIDYHHARALKQKTDFEQPPEDWEPIC